MALRPSRWILYAPVAVLPFFAALFLDAPRLHDDLLERVNQAAGDAGKGWASIALDGRDVTLSGDSPSDEQLAAVADAVRKTAGVRKLENRARIVYPPPASPTVTPAAGLWTGLVIAGTWPEGNGNTLRVTLGGQTAILGKDDSLKSDGTGNWSLKPAKILEPGTYDVTVTATTPKGVSASDTSKDEITVTEPPVLNPPTVDKLDTNLSQPVLKGRWDPAVARGLSVSVGDTLYMLGEGSALTVKDSSWSLAFPAKLADGVYDIIASVTDDFGRTARTELKAGLLVDTTPPAAPVIESVSQDLPLKAAGTWPARDAVSLTVTLAGKVWTLGKDSALTSPEEGRWTFAPDLDLKPGTYDLAVEAADRLGNVSRDATNDEVLIPEPPPMVAPTVSSQLTNNARPVIRGTWPSAVADSLSVTLGGTTYENGKSSELATDSDNWTLTPSQPLADGAYDVTVSVADKRGRTAAATAPGKITVDTVAPSAPTLNAFRGEPPVTLSGGWAEGDAAGLGVTVDAQGWTLGKDAALSSDGKGHWTLAPGALTLAPGPHKVTVTATDAAGNESALQSADGVTVLAPPPPPPPPPPAMAMPTVEKLVSEVPRPVLHGTFSEGIAKTLSVWIAGTAHELGSAPELSTDGKGRWTLTLTEPLADGAYDVVVTTSDGKGLSLTDSTRDELVVDAQGPGTPTVDLYAGNASPAAISGSYDSAGTKSLTVSVPDAAITAAPGQGLTVKGNSWSLALPRALTPGSHDVVAEAVDARGRIARDQTRFEIFIKEPPPPPPPPAAGMKAPTVNAVSADRTPDVITGTWDEAAAKSLAVAIDGAGVNAALGAGTALTSDGKGNWSLKLSAALAPGVYDVAVTETDASGRTARDSSTAELYIKSPPPPPPPPPPPSPSPEMKVPTVDRYSGSDVPKAITGTWDEGSAKSLRVAIAGTGVAAALGADTALSSDGKGRWTLALPSPLAAGVYNVSVATADAAGRTITDTTEGELIITAKTVVPPPPPSPPPLDCDAAFAGLPKLRFDFNHVSLTGAHREVLAAAVRVLTDPACLNRRLEITGYADYWGGQRYNDWLSLERAKSVAAGLVAMGVDAARLDARGVGERDLEDPTFSREAWAKNRRVIMTLQR